MKRWRLLEKRKKQEYSREDLFQEWNKSIIDYSNLQDKHLELQSELIRFQDKYIALLNTKL